MLPPSSAFLYTPFSSFTDSVGSTALKQQLSAQGPTALLRNHHQRVRELLARFATGQKIETAGDSFLIIFSTPSDAVRFGLLLQTSRRQFREKAGVNLLGPPASPTLPASRSKALKSRSRHREEPCSPWNPGRREARACT